MKARELVNIIKKKRGQLLAVFLLLILLIIAISYKGDGYFKVFNTVYYLNENIKSPDPSNFIVLEKGFARDDVWVYYKGYKFSKGDPSEFKIVDDKYCVDERNAYMYFPGRRILRIPNSDADSFVVLNRDGYSMDKNSHYYVDGDKFYTMLNEGFEFIDDNEEYNSRDVFRYYKNGKMVKMTSEWSDHLSDISYEIAERDQERELRINRSSRNKINDVYAKEIFSYKVTANRDVLGFFPVYNFKCSTTMKEALLDPFQFYMEPTIEINGVSVKARKECIEDEESCYDIESPLYYQLNNNAYNLINGCLYKGDEKVFDYNLLVKRGMGYFSDEDNLEIPENRIGHTWENASEWFRFEDDNNLYIYLKGGAGCGGCIFNGPYLKIDLNTGEVEGYKMKKEYIPNVELSLDKKKAIITEFFYSLDNDTGLSSRGAIKLYLYDFVKNKRVREVYEVPGDKTILFEGMGANVIDNSITWVDENRIQIINYDISSDGEAEASILEDEDGFTTVSGYKNPNEPIIINVDGTGILDTVNSDNWQVYKDEVNNFSVKYPPDWYFEDYSVDFDHPYFGFYPNGKEKGWEYLGDVVLGIGYKPSKADLDSIIGSDDEINVAFRHEKTDGGAEMKIAYNVPGMIERDLIYIDCNDCFVTFSSPLGMGRVEMEEMARTFKCQY